MATMYDYQQVAINCSHFKPKYGTEFSGMRNEPEINESCTICEHFDEHRSHCRLDLYDKILSSLTSYYYLS